MDDAPDAAAKEPHVKGDEEAQDESSGFQVGEDLRGMDRREVLECFQLDNELLFYEEVEPPFTDPMALVLHTDSNLPGKPDATMRQLHAKRLFINRFQEPRTQQSVHL